MSSEPSFDDNPSVFLRHLVASEILATQDESGYLLNDFRLIETNYPAIKITDLPDGGLVSVIDLGYDAEVTTRSGVLKVHFPIQLAFQKLVSKAPQEALSEIDGLKRVVNQFRNSMRTAVSEDDRFTFLMTESLKDENDTPYGYMGMREANTFEAYITARYYSILTEL